MVEIMVKQILVQISEYLFEPQLICNSSRRDITIIHINYIGNNIIIYMHKGQDHGDIIYSGMVCSVFTQAFTIL